MLHGSLQHSTVRASFRSFTSAVILAFGATLIPTVSSPWYLATVDEAVKKAHIDNINKSYNGAKNLYVCPLCGGNLIHRTARKGPNAGKQFWGCSNYPQCRYIKNI